VGLSVAQATASVTAHWTAARAPAGGSHQKLGGV